MKADIPAKFFKKNNAMGIYCIVHGLALWFGLAYTASLVYGHAQIPIFLQIPLIAVLIFISGLGMFYISTLGHEGFHGNLNTNRDVSMLMGIFASSAIPMLVTTGYTVIHWPHHLFTNTLKDPDYASYSRYKNVFSRICFGPMQSGTSFFINAINLVFAPEKNDSRHYPFPEKKARSFAIVNLLLTGIAAIFYISFAIVETRLFIFMVVLPSFIALCYLGMVPFIDHAETGLERGGNARNYTSIIFTAIFLGTNYHREHHLYPNVPTYKLITLHRYLRNNGFLSSNAIIEPSFFKVLAIGATKKLDY